MNTNETMIALLADMPAEALHDITSSSWDGTMGPELLELCETEMKNGEVPNAQA